MTEKDKICYSETGAATLRDVALDFAVVKKEMPGRHAKSDYRRADPEAPVVLLFSYFIGNVFSAVL